MDENRNNPDILSVEEEQSSFNFETIYTAFILNWKWFLLSVLICVGIGFLYLRYTTPIYSTNAKLLIKDEDNRRSSRGGLRAIESASNLGIISNSYGVDNEQEILKSTTVAEQCVRNLKLYVNYNRKGKLKNYLLYKNQPITVDMDFVHLDKLSAPISMKITRNGSSYEVSGKYYIPIDEVTNEGPVEFEQTFNAIPAVVMTKVGAITLTRNGSHTLKDGETMLVTITSPLMAAYRYAGALSINQTNKTSTIFSLQLNDQSVPRALDYLRELAVCYNEQANEDKDEIARKTESFINERLQKISDELSSTDGNLESYKRQNGLVEVAQNAVSASSNAVEYAQKLKDAETQVALINSLINFASLPENKYQVLPSNIGLNDDASTSLINEYNKITLERNRLLRTASETSPVIIELTAQLDDMKSSIRQALYQSKKSLEIRANAIRQQLGTYTGEVTKMPEQERILTQIGRQREVKSGLYLMLLQKREENSISLAATADKGKLIENPRYGGQVSPKKTIIMLISLILGLAIPSLVLFLINFFRYKIEGHEDVAKLTKLPIIADIALASEGAKAKADIVVKENQNNQMEEIFRSMRTNIQFMLKEGENVIMFTSSISGEGKTFTASNMAVSFALLGKKVVLVGLDIRKPRLSDLFSINNHHNGITNLLVLNKPEWSDVKEQIIPSGVNGNLDLLMAGPIPPNPSELVSRQSLEEVINLLKQNYDYVIMDTAPVGLVSDTLQIGKYANISVCVCRADYTPKSSLGLFNSLVEDYKMNNVCIAINGIDMSKKKHGYNYGYGKYGKYGQLGKYRHYGSYSGYGNYGVYANSHYSNKDDDSIKR